MAENMENPEQPAEMTTSAATYKSLIYDWVKTIITAVVLALFIRTTIVGAYVVPTGSMKPTIGIGDRLLGCKFFYWFAQPKSGDIVVFEPPPEANTDVPRFVKRVVAVEGDTVEIKNRALYVNGQRVEEPYVDPPRYPLATIKVPKDHLFVLGDNRNNSADGHAWIETCRLKHSDNPAEQEGCGFLPKKNVEAKIVFRFWPLTRIGVVN